MKNEALVLSTAEPINDGGRRWNFIYFVSAIAMFVVFIAIGSNFWGWIFAIGLGCVVGWLIKNKIAETHAKMLRNTKFAVQNKIEYSQLIHELIPRLTPLGALVEKSSNENGSPVIAYQGAMYDITYNEDNTFCVWWRQNLVRAFFSVDYIKIYRKEVAAMGIIAYHIQQICETNDKNIEQSDCSGVCEASIKEEAPHTTDNVVKKKKSKVLWIILGFILISVIGTMITGIDDSETESSSYAEQEVLEKLQTFTTVYQDDDRYYFLDNGEKWVLTYTSENEFVSFENATVIECFTDAFGEGCFSEGSVSELGFAYDLRDNQARIYFDVDIADGHLTIINYDLSDQEYELMIDGERWTTTDAFTDHVEKYALAQSIEKDVKTFKDILQQEELTVDDLLKVKYDTLKSQFIPDTEENSESSIDTSLGWKKAYLDYLKGIDDTDYGYSLDYIDGDDVPELIIDHRITAEGIELCTYDGEKVIATPVGESFKYRLKENLFCVSGGGMDYYYDNVYEIVDGVPKEVSCGRYGALDYQNIMYDENGSMIYQYTWNGESVSEYDYYTFLDKFSYENNPDTVYPAGGGYLYDIIEVLEHPLDITLIDPYLNNNGYESMLNHYVILFDGLEGDKLHFTVKYNDELVGSVTATIIDAKTAEYKNTKNELVIKFGMDYKKLEIEGYMDTIDLTGSYMGRWG